MTNMFKKSLVALAIAGFATSAMAANVQTYESGDPAVTTNLTDARLVSTQYLELATDDEYVSNNLLVELGAEYATNDAAVFVANIAPDAWPANATVAAAAGTKGITFGLVSTSADGRTANYRVTDITGAAADLTTGVVVDFGTLTFAASDVAAAGGADVTYTASTNTGGDLDRGGNNAADLIGVESQFAFDLEGGFDQVIEVNEGRQEFEDGTTDVAEYTVDAGIVFDDPATVDLVTHVISGNFGWVDADLDPADIVDTAAAPGVIFTVANCAGLGDVDLTASALTFSCTDVGDVVVTVDVSENTDYGTADAAVLTAQSFSLTGTVDYSVGAATSSASLTAGIGSWTLNGSSVNVPYMPYGTGIDQVINLSNNGTQTGEITIEGFARGSDTGFGPIVVGTALPGRQVALAGAIADALADEGITNERVSMTIVTNVPAGDVTVYSAYNVNGTGARLVVNDSNGATSNNQIGRAHV